MTSDEQETMRPKQTQFLEKKYSTKGKLDSLWTLRNITPFHGSCYKAIDSSISQEILLYLKMLSMQCRKKTLELKIKKKRMTIASYINIYTCVIRDGNDSNKNESIKLNSAVWSFCWQKLLCSIYSFRISISDPVSRTLQMEGSYHLLSYTD